MREIQVKKQSTKKHKQKMRKTSGSMLPLSKLFTVIILTLFIIMVSFQQGHILVQAKTFSPNVILSGIADFLNIFNWGGSFLPVSGDNIDFSSGSYVSQLGGLFNPTLCKFYCVCLPLLYLSKI